MSHTIFQTEKLIVEYSSVNGELWFVCPQDQKREHISVLNLNDREHRKNFLKAARDPENELCMDNE